MSSIFKVFGVLLLSGLGASSLRADAAPTERHSPGPESEVLYAAVWSASAPESRFLEVADPSDPPVVEGFRLVDIEVVVIDGKRRYSGFYRAGEASTSTLLTDLDEAGFQQALVQEAQAGRHLEGFETWLEDGATRYAGVFVAGCQPWIVETNLSLIDFTRRQEELSSDHRLVDLESVVIDGRSRFSGLWHAGSLGKEWVLLGVSYETFHDLTHDLSVDGYRLIDLDVQLEPCKEGVSTPHEHCLSYRQPWRNVVSGVLRTGGAEDWLGVGYHDKGLSCAISMLGSGQGSSGISSYGEVLCGKKDWILPPPSKKPLRLVVVESFEGLPDPEYGNHGPPLHDSGTAGPP